MNFRKLEEAFGSLGFCRSEWLHDGLDGSFFGATITFNGVKYFSLKLFEEKFEEVMEKGIEEGWMTEEERLVCYDMTVFDTCNVRALLVTKHVAGLYDDLKESLGLRGVPIDVSLYYLFEQHGYRDLSREQVSTLFLLASLPSFYFPFDAFLRIAGIIRDDYFFEFNQLMKDENKTFEKVLPYLPNARLMMAISNIGGVVKTLPAGKLPASMFDLDILHCRHGKEEALTWSLGGRATPVRLVGSLRWGDTQSYAPAWVTNVRVSGKHGDAEYSVEFDYVEDRWANERHGEKQARIGIEFASMPSLNYRIVPTFNEEGYISSVETIIGSY